MRITSTRDAWVSFDHHKGDITYLNDMKDRETHDNLKSIRDSIDMLADLGKRLRILKDTCKSALDAVSKTYPQELMCLSLK
jgi:hypothetical protein